MNLRLIASVVRLAIRVVPVILRAVPVILIVVLSTPAWLTWPFLSDPKQKRVVEMVDALARWTQGNTRDT